MSGQRVAVKVWDGWVRLFHWGVVACLVVSYVSAQVDAWDVHYLSGYTILALVVFRILWGLVGSENARFATFLRSPIAALRELAHFGRHEPDTDTTHNPAGAWMVLLLLAMLLVQAVSGLFTNHDVGFTYSAHGPFANSVAEATSEWASILHVTFINLLLAAIAVHVLAVLAYALVKRQDLVRPMVTGVKRLPDSVARGPRHAPALLGLVLLAASGAAVWWVTRFGG
ncbi:cytochrome b/b6 domain-containing protein [Roseomonas sp. HJA6]|uniref:Cytochrome b/b6 domain-containing protein n=1 Tax=Roseomonas alba TaxID=2846776 RepID=A0ABS7ACC5_9PROT|nr:cytochrome b/b6 domain-containing protein [Neoroseomonas alba]MBW6399954.1 cytochrome b/b6 domain-containing protein [Neoroseomonas alba]